MRLFTMLLSLTLVCALLSVSAQASRGLEQIRYELFKNPQADVEADLRTLVARGDRAAMLLLGDVLAAEEVSAHRETIELYNAAFANGQGEVSALGALAKLIEHYPYWREQYRDYFRRALQLYPHSRDQQTLASTLEVFLSYPQLLEPAAAQRLIELHQSACLLDCSTELYWAVLAQLEGDAPLADRLYQQAMITDARAAERYYSYLGERQNSLFPQIARDLEPQIDDMTADAINRVSMVLDRIADLYRIDEQVAQRQRREQSESLGIALEPKPPGFVAESQRIRSEALQWAEVSAARGWLPAMVSRFYFMTSMPDNYSGAEALEFIEQIRVRDPDLGKTLLVSALMVTNWNTLNPPKAHDLIEELIAEGHPEGRMLLGDLYSRGGLDEPDQQQALAIYQTMAQRGSAAAYYRQASVYASGRAICHDHPRAYAYAMVAVDFGVERARGLMHQLELQMSESGKSEALDIRNTIIRDFGI